jgi:hypothetical protein
MKTNFSKLCLSILLLLFAQLAQSQDTSAFQPSKVVLYLNLSAFIDLSNPTAAIGINYAIKPKHRIEHETGYIYESPLNVQKGFSGWRLRSSYQYCLPVGLKDYAYVGIQGTYKILSGDIENFVWRDNRTYQQNIRFNANLRTVGFNSLIGFAGVSKRITYDFQIGLGSRWTTFNYKDLPADAEAPSFPFFIHRLDQIASNGATLQQLTVHAAFKIGVVLSK